MAQRAAMRTHVKKYLKSVDGSDSDIEVAEKEYRIAVSHVDRAVRRGLHHRNKAARLKSRLNARLKNAVTPT
jgi:small subunit ribosomal protein S20